MKNWSMVWILLGSSLLMGTVIPVPGTAPTIQEGINQASHHDTVLVAPGTYFENINFKGKNILLTSHIILNQDMSVVTSTIIDGSQPAYADSGSCVSIMSGEDSTAILQGFTITKGIGLKTYWQWYPSWVRTGGGVVVHGASPVIRYNLIIDNNLNDRSEVGHTRGGGISTFGDSNARIYNNIITKNSAQFGGAVSFYYDLGGSLQNNIISYNGSSNQFNGGCLAIGLNLNEVFIENNTIVNNGYMPDFPAFGVLINFWHRGKAYIRNNICWGNAQPKGQQLIMRNDGAEVVVENNLMEGGYQGDGNLDVDPDFFDESLFFLNETSLCIDAGHSDAIYSDPSDPNNASQVLYPALGSTRNDIGAYGGPFSHPLFIYQHVSKVESPNIKLPDEIIVARNYPNPFNPSTSIFYHVTQSTRMMIHIYSIEGKLIRCLLNNHMKSGEHQIAWDGTNNHGEAMPSGIYLCRLQTDVGVQTIRMVLQK